MHQLTVRQCRAIDLEQAPTLPALVAEYAAESTRTDLGDYNPQFQMYRKIEELGLMRFAGAWIGESLVGFAVVCVTIVPHYGKLIATTESLFVTAEARRAGAGRALMKEAENIAKEMGADGLFVSAPANGRLAAILPRSGFTHTNQVFYKGFA